MIDPRKWKFDWVGERRISTTDGLANQEHKPRVQWLDKKIGREETWDNFRIWEEIQKGRTKIYIEVKSD